MTGVVISVLAALVTLVVVLLALRLPRVTGGQTDERVAAVTIDLRSRMEAMRLQLGEALEQAQAEAGRNRFVGELAQATSLEGLVRLALDAAEGLVGADAAAISALGPDGRRIVANSGLSAEEARAVAGASLPEGPEARSAFLIFRYDDRERQRIRTGLWVPLPADRGSLGQLAVFSRSEDRPFDVRDARQLEALARQVGRALQDARIVQEARSRRDLDAVTGLPHRARFAEILEQQVEAAKAQREGLAVAVFDLTDFGAINRRVGHEAGDAALIETGRRASNLLGPDDVLCRIGSDEFGAILPGGRAADGERFLRRLRAALAGSPAPGVGRLSFAAAVAELDPEEEAGTFFERAEDALARARSGGGQIVVAESWVVDF